MSQVSYAAGTRFLSLIGGTILSFYDWYADMPIASPQVFGDQTDVPESGDWWNAAYLIIWGTNLPITRTPDAHFMTEARYRGQKVVVVSPDYSDHTKFADDWLPAAPGTDGALAMAMGHVVLTEFFRDRQVPYFTDYVKTYTDAPFLVTLREQRRRLRARPVPDRRRPRRAGPRAPQHKTVLLDAATGEPKVPERLARLPLHPGRPGQVEPRPRRHRPGAHPVWPTRRGGPGGPAQVRHRRDRGRCVGPPRRPGRPDRRPPGDHGLRPADGAVCRAPRGPARRVAGRLRRRGHPGHPGVAGADHLGARRPRRPGWPGSSPATRSCPGAGR